MKTLFLGLFAAVSLLYGQAFPARVATPADLPPLTNDCQTKLRLSAGSNDSIIYVHDASCIVVNQLLTLDANTARSEIVQVASMAGTALTVTRGQDGKSAVPHVQGATVAGYVTRKSLQSLQDEVIAMQNALGPGLINVGAALTAPNLFTSDEVLMLPSTDSVWVRSFFRETTVKPGRHYTLALTMDLCGANPANGSCVPGLVGGSGDKLPLFVTAQPGLAKTTTLAALVNVGANSITVADGSLISASLQSNYPQAVQIDSEELPVCARAGNLLVLCSPATAAHSNGATVSSVTGVWGENIQVTHRPDVPRTNLVGLEIDALENFGDYSGSGKQTVGLIMSSAGYYKPAYGIRIDSAGPYASTNGWYAPFVINNNSQRGVLVGPSSSPIDVANTSAAVGAKQLVPGGNVFFGQRLSDVSPTGNFLAFYTLSGSQLAWMDTQSNFTTSGYIRAQGGAPSIDYFEGDQSTGGRLWHTFADNGRLNFATCSDDGVTCNVGGYFTRSGSNPSLFVLNVPFVGAAMPTSCSGQLSGTMYNNAGTAKFCP